MSGTTFFVFGLWGGEGGGRVVGFVVALFVCCFLIRQNVGFGFLH